jgi:hypothetical protein
MTAPTALGGLYAQLKDRLHGFFGIFLWQLSY